MAVSSCSIRRARKFVCPLSDFGNKFHHDIFFVSLDLSAILQHPEGLCHISTIADIRNVVLQDVDLLGHGHADLD